MEKIEQKMPTVAPPATIANEPPIVPTLEKQKSQMSVSHQQSQTSNSNIYNSSSKEIQQPTKKNPNAIIGMNFGIETVIENINMSKETKLIHNGLVRKEAALEAMSQTTDTFRITKTEFAKL